MISRFIKQPWIAACAAILPILACPMALADAPVNAQQLGMIERVLEFCGPIDTTAAQKLQAKVTEISKGASEESLGKARGSDDYKKARAFMDGIIEQMDPGNAKAVCSDTAGT
jgi:hypothetical protein